MLRRRYPSWQRWIALATTVLCGIVGLARADLDFDRLRALALQRYGSGAGATVDAWRQLVAGTQVLNEADKLERVNTFFNRAIRFDDDSRVWGKPDYWATPLQTLGVGAGDCEDFAIAKYVTLQALGVPIEKLRLIYVRAQIGGPASRITQAHMVLGYYADPAAEPLVLDNLIGEIRPASRRADLFPVFAFNSAGLWVGGNQAAADPTARLSRWRDLLSRMAEEGFR